MHTALSKKVSHRSTKSPSTKRAGRTSPPASMLGTEATALLRADHKSVDMLFEQFEKARTSAQKKRIVAQICQELTVHAQIEEEIFYPAVKTALKDTELVPEATVEHATLKELIAEVEGIDPDGEMYDAKIQVMSEYVRHHVKEEQNEMFPKAKASSKLDLNDLGAQMLQRKAALILAYAATRENEAFEGRADSKEADAHAEPFGDNAAAMTEGDTSASPEADHVSA